jgi:hypothetical protein
VTRLDVKRRCPRSRHDAQRSVAAVDGAPARGVLLPPDAQLCKIVLVYCDVTCQVVACNYDNGDCGDTTECAPGGPASWSRDDFCDPECNIATCYHDGADCRRAAL